MARAYYLGQNLEIFQMLYRDSGIMGCTHPGRQEATLASAWSLTSWVTPGALHFMTTGITSFWVVIKHAVSMRDSNCSVFVLKETIFSAVVNFPSIGTEACWLAGALSLACRYVLLGVNQLPGSARSHVFQFADSADYLGLWPQHLYFLFLVLCFSDDISSP